MVANLRSVHAFRRAIQTVEKGMQLLYRLFPIGLWRRVIVSGAVRRPVNPALKSHVNGLDNGAQVQVDLFGDWPGPTKYLIGLWRRVIDIKL